MAAEGYPGKPRTGDIIEGLNDAAARENVRIFHSGTDRNSNGDFITAGGRVLGVTATGDDLGTALLRSDEAVSEISWPGVQLRNDIGK